MLHVERWDSGEVPYNYPKELATENPDLTLLRLFPGAGRFVYPLYDRNRAHLARAGEAVRFTSPDEVDAILTRFHPKRVSYVMTASDGRRERFAGVMGIAPHPFRSIGTLSYFTDEAHQGRGFATAAANAVISHGFEQAGFTQAWANIMERNVASQHVATKAGLEQSGPPTQDGILLFIRTKK